MPGSRITAGDRKLVQIADAAFADAARRSGDWLVCRPGCTQCCVGIFAINQLDALRLQQGLRKLDDEDPARAERIRRRAHNSVARLSKGFPGDRATGVLDQDDPRFAEFANDEPCPVLDPLTGTCDLYESRPMTCRIFGPPVRSEEGLGACELCYHGATDEEIIKCEIKPDPEDLESALLKKLESKTGKTGLTIVAYALTCRPEGAQGMR